MATPNFEQIQSFGNVSKQLMQGAVNDFMELYSANMSTDEVIELASAIAEQYGFLASELGAQWYDLCTRLANIDAEPAVLSDADSGSIRERAKSMTEKYSDKPRESVLNRFLQNEIQNSIRITGDANLWRDYERGLCSGKWARVPVGDTCAWCLMLASQGAWYLSRESALGNNGSHYHDGCNCIAVYHADANSIPNYSNLQRYKSMYYDAENARIANASGKRPYSDELQERITRAREEHNKRYEEAKKRGEEQKKWTKYNETLIVMRWQNEGLH